MSRVFKNICATLSAFSCFALVADESSFYATIETMPEFSSADAFQVPVQEFHSESKATPKTQAPFTPFTGKIKGKKVRLRLSADLDSKIIKELNKNELVSIVGEKEDFWAVQPPADTKVYVFRSFVLDNVVEGNRVNVRLEPSLEAPVVAHLNAGEQLVNPVISPINNKWLEIAPPPQTHFYIAKDYIDYAGGPEFKAQHDRRMATVGQILEATAVLSQSELRKPFEEVDFDRIAGNYNTVIHDYTDFPEMVEHAKEALTAFQELYLEKRIAYLASRPTPEQIAAQQQKEQELRELSLAMAQVTDKMRAWDSVEESLYSNWAALNENRSKQEFYEEQKLSAVIFSGIVEAYNSPVKNKPGDYMIRDKDFPVAYLYSTQVNLQSLVGRHVTVVASQRSNNNFAFPAYYVLTAE